MAALDLIFGQKKRVRIGVGASDEFLPVGAVEMDASLSESHQAANEVTRHPVEQGSDITDHVRRQPERVTITGVITDTPTTLGGALEENRSLSAFEKFLEMKDRADLVTVVTSLRQYSNMVIESYSIPRDARRGQSVEITLNLVEILTAQIAEIPPEPAAGTQSSRGTVDLGSQGTTALP